MKVNNSKVKWIKNFKSIKKGQLFFGNEFFDAIPIKQYAFLKIIYMKSVMLLTKKMD